MHLALYRSERPENFNEIIGQKHIVKILTNQLKKGSISQSYLFTGTRGTGKTTTARIIAKAVNCIGNVPDEQKPCCECENCRAIKAGSFLDVIELDAASNNGVEDLRAIIDSVQYPPAYGKYKVYIIDEVHMLTQSAENAFLKTLEEPPEYAIFILATTNPEKVRQTIRSRCMTLNFRRVSENELKDGMRAICDRRGIGITDEALAAVATRADGSVRDALSILEQCISGGDELVTYDLVLDYLGSAGMDFYIALTDAVISGNAAQALVYVDSIIKDGKDSKQVLSDWLLHFRDLMISKYLDDPTGIVNASAENVGRLKEQASKLSAGRIEGIITLLSEYVNQTKYSAQPRILLETAVVQILSGQGGGVKQAITDTIDQSYELGNMKAQMANAEVKKTRTKEQQPRVSTPQPANQAYQPARPSRQPEPAKTTVEQVNEVAPEPAKGPVLTEGSINLDAMWKRVVDEVSNYVPSFKIMVGNYSRVQSFKNDELLVIVRKNKVAVAEINKEHVERVVKMIFGSTAFVTFKAGDISQVRQAAPASGSGSEVQAGPVVPAPARQEQPAASVNVQEEVTEPEPAYISPVEIDIDMDSFGMEEDVSVDQLFEMESMSNDENSLADDIAGDAAALLGMTVDVLDI